MTSFAPNTRLINVKAAPRRPRLLQLNPEVTKEVIIINNTTIIITTITTTIIITTIIMSRGNVLLPQQQVKLYQY